MASPQKERGFTIIANELMDAFARSDFFDSKARLVFWFLRNTYGDYGKKSVSIPSLRRMGKGMDMDHRALTRAVDFMVGIGFLKNKGDEYFLNKNWEGWDGGPGRRIMAALGWGPNGTTTEEGGVEVRQSGVEVRQSGVEMGQNFSDINKVVNYQDKRLTTKDGEAVLQKPQHIDFMDRFKVFYEKVTRLPFKFDKVQFVLVKKLIDQHGTEMVAEKTKILGAMCRHKSAWFTKEGWSDFSIQTLSKHWNRILPDERTDPENAKKQIALEAIRKAREDRERITKAIHR